MLSAEECLKNYTAGTQNGWNRIETWDERTLLLFERGPLTFYNSSNGTHTVGVRHQLNQPFQKFGTGEPIGADHGYDFWKPYDGNLRPLPGEVKYDNPLTVVAVIVPVTSGIVLIRRNDQSTRGKISLMSGFQETKDRTWQVAAARETYEESGIVLDPTRLFELGTETVENGKINLLFSMYMRRLPDPKPRPANDEILEVLTTDRPIETAFPAHTMRIQEFFRRVKEYDFPPAVI